MSELSTNQSQKLSPNQSPELSKEQGKGLDKERPRDQQYDAACQFIIKLGTAVHHYGPSAARLESYLTAVCKALGYEGVFRSTPSEITFAFSKPEQWWQHTHIAVVPVGGYNMAKLSEVGNLVEELVASKVTLTEASNRLDEIEALPNPWGKWTYPLSFVLVAMGFSGLLQGRVLDIIASAGLSLGVYILVILAEKRKGRFLDALPFTSAFFAGSSAALLNLWFPELNHMIVTLAAIVILVPGFMISAGIVEIVENYIIAGSARLFGGLVYLIKQFTGAWLGVSFIGLFGAMEIDIEPLSMSNQDTAVFIICLMVGLGVAYQTLWRDFVWVMINCTLAYIIVLSCSQLVSADLGVLFAASVTCMFANLWARTTKRPTSIVLIPAITILVSGSIGFRGLLTVAAEQSDQGMQQFSQMFIVALAIAAGLLIGNLIVRPKITL